jgi:hypothetical protein
MATRTIREEIYDDSGLIEVKHYEVEETPITDQIKQKEDELLRVYQEIERLKTFTALS